MPASFSPFPQVFWPCPLLSVVQTKIQTWLHFIIHFEESRYLAFCSPPSLYNGVAAAHRQSHSASIISLSHTNTRRTACLLIKMPAWTPMFEYERRHDSTEVALFLPVEVITIEKHVYIRRAPTVWRNIVCSETVISIVNMSKN